MARTIKQYAIPAINPVHNADPRFASKNRMETIIATHVTRMQSKAKSAVDGANVAYEY
jgi:hypothetical protein